MSTIENGSCDRDVSQPGPTEFASNAPLVLRYDNDNAGGIRDGHGFYDEDSHQGTTPSFDISATSAAEATTTVTPAGSTTTRTTTAWEPSGIWWRDMLYFVGPGWLVSIAYIDPGNYQADIQAGATTQYYLIFSIWWSSILSIYVQVLCVRLGYYSQLTLAQVQAREFRDQGSTWKRYLAWFLAEFSVILTDLPEVIGIGIACNLFFGWPYWIGVVLSMMTTMTFLATMQYGMHILEGIIVAFVGIMSLALFLEMAFVQPDASEIVKGWVYGFVDVTADDLFTIAGIIGAVVMPHNLYLHTASVQNRKVVRRDDVVRKAVWYCSVEPIVPIVVSFFVNLAVVAIAAERVYGTDNAALVGLTDFCDYFSSIPGACFLWGIALLAAGQSSAITTTYTGQYIMDGFLEIRLPLRVRAIATRLVAIAPCVVVSVFFPRYLNHMVNIVNAALGFLLPFALLPLIKYNCSESIMGADHASGGFEKNMLYGFGIFVWLINATTLSVPGGGFFGDFVNRSMEWSLPKIGWILFEIIVQASYARWNYSCLFDPLADEAPEDASSFVASERSLVGRLPVEGDVLVPAETETTSNTTTTTTTTTPSMAETAFRENELT